MDLETFDFRDHIQSIKWIDQLPSGLVTQQIDLRNSSVNITKQEDGVQIYIGPKNPDLGGDGITIMLDQDLKLLDYEIERIEPICIGSNPTSQF